MSEGTFVDQTEITEDVVKELRAMSDEGIAEFKKAGGGMIGDKEPTPEARLNGYWQSVTGPDGMPDMHDVALIMPDEHGRFVSETLIRQGLSDGPHSPTWLNYLRIEGMFTEKAKDFVHLNQLDQERNAREGPSVAVPEVAHQGNAPYAPSAGPPVPVAAAAGPPQPNYGGGAGSYGPPQ